MTKYAARDKLGGLCRPLILVAILAAAWLGSLSCGPGNGTEAPQNSVSSSGSTRTNDEGSVSIRATWDGRLRPAEFRIAFDTHSVDLDAYDLSRLVVLRIDGGADITPVSSDSPKGGHHRQATLIFELPAGGAAASEGFSRLELVIREVGGTNERVLRWESQAPE